MKKNFWFLLNHSVLLSHNAGLDVYNTKNRLDCFDLFLLPFKWHTEEGRNSIVDRGAAFREYTNFEIVYAHF